MSTDQDPVAVVDVGSGSVKLLITGPAGLVDPDRAAVITNVKTRLIDGDGGRLAPRALAATAEAFDHFASIIAEHRPTAVRVVGTAAARQLEALAELEDLALRRLGVPLEVISGEREAELSLQGMAAGRDPLAPLAVIDIGGGSTEFAVRIDGEAARVFSMPLGGHTVTSAYLDGDPPRPEELSAALSVIELHLDDLRREIPELIPAVETGVVIGGGAITQIAEVEIGIPDPDAESVEGYLLEREATEEVFRALATESAADRAHNPGLRPEHVGDIVGAMCVLVEFKRQFGIDRLTVSERSLMHGLAAELMAER